MICEKCKEYCLCATCVYNPYYAVNTPKPCIGADCDICIGDGETIFCRIVKQWRTQGKANQ